MRMKPLAPGYLMPYGLAQGGFWMKRNNRKKTWVAWLSSAAALALSAALLLLFGDARPSDAAGVGQPDRVMAQAKLAQTIDYARCWHQVLRRLDVPDGWVGMDREAVQRAMEPGWRLIAFAPQTLEMACAPDLFCPAHWVLMLDEDGEPAIFQNAYGFEMERQSQADFHPPDEATRALLARGLAFDSLADLQQWMAAPIVQTP
jgi:hypothetical protein